MTASLVASGANRIYVTLDEIPKNDAGKTLYYRVSVSDEAGNTSTAAGGRALEVQPEALDPTEPTITLTPAQPVAGEKVEIPYTISGGSGNYSIVEEVFYFNSDRSEVMNDTIKKNGKA